MNRIFFNLIFFSHHFFFYIKIKELDDLLTSCRKFNSNIKTFDCSVFNGEYVTGCVTSKYLDDLENVRNDLAKNRLDILHSPDTIGLHNNFGCNGKS
jgi:amidophosphoribosyltransferase